MTRHRQKGYDAGGRGLSGQCQPDVYPARAEHQLRYSGTEAIIIYGGSTPVLAEIIANTPIKRVISIDPGDGAGLPVPSPQMDAHLSDTTAFADVLKQGAEMNRGGLRCRSLCNVKPRGGWLDQHLPSSVPYPKYAVAFHGQAETP